MLFGFISFVHTYSKSCCIERHKVRLRNFSCLFSSRIDTYFLLVTHAKAEFFNTMQDSLSMPLSLIKISENLTVAGSYRLFRRKKKKQTQAFCLFAPTLYMLDNKTCGLSVLFRQPYLLYCCPIVLVKTLV